MMEPQQASPKRPRLSLQIKPSVSGPVCKPSRTIYVNPSDPTTFNTLSNVYVTAVERSLPAPSEPLTAINTLEAFSIATPVDRKPDHLGSSVLPETPVSLNADSPPKRAAPLAFPSAMTATPPSSAIPSSATESRSSVFSFSRADTACSHLSLSLRSPIATRPFTPKLASSHPNKCRPPPYTHPSSLRSILRNSPLPRRTGPLHSSSASSRKQIVRLAGPAPRRVSYDSPIEQEITTTLYTYSHVDLFVDEPSPVVTTSSYHFTDTAASTADTTTLLPRTTYGVEDGGSTPGDLESMRRKMGRLDTAPASSPTAASGSASLPSSPAGFRKRKRRGDNSRRWVWTIGDEEEDDDDEHPGGAVAALRAAKAREQQQQTERQRSAPDTENVSVLNPVDLSSSPPHLDSCDTSIAESQDTELSDASSVHSPDTSFMTTSDAEDDAATPTVSTKHTQEEVVGAQMEKARTIGQPLWAF